MAFDLFTKRQPSCLLSWSFSTTMSPAEMWPMSPTVAPSSWLTMAIWMSLVFLYGSQFARMLNQAYRDGMMQTPSVMMRAMGFLRMRLMSRQKILRAVFTCRLLGSRSCLVNVRVMRGVVGNGAYANVAQ